MRLFIAISISTAVSQSINNLKEMLCRDLSGVRWTHRENMHLTLKFLGKTNKDKVFEINKILKDLASRASPFSISVNGGGAFPSLKSPKTLWCGVQEGKKSLTQLNELLETQLSLVGFAREKRPFRPHITIGRITKRVSHNLDLEALLNRFYGNSYIKEIKLMQSQLFSSGPVYRPVSVYLFGGIYD